MEHKEAREAALALIESALHEPFEESDPGVTDSDSDFLASAQARKAQTGRWEAFRIVEVEDEALASDPGLALEILGGAEDMARSFARLRKLRNG
jgi:hypothetical protein